MLAEVTFAETLCAPQQIAKLTANDGASDDRFGISVALDGGVAVIGAYSDDDNTGSTYVYEQQGDGTWQHIAKLTANDGASSDEFGYSVATSGGVVVIGANGDNDNGSDSGSAYVYEQQEDGTWQQIAKLTADDGASDDRFGISVAIDGGVAVIGAHYDDDNDFNSGSAYVFEQQADGTWQQIAKLTADDGASDDYFGSSVAIDGGVAVIGAYRDDDAGSDSGSAYVYEQQANGTWQQIAKLTADDGASNDKFGRSVAIDGDMAVIGAPNDKDNGYNSGSAYVFEQQADRTWQQIAKLTADDGGSDDIFGLSVALDAGVAVIGAWSDDDSGEDSGSAYVYEQQADGTWQQIAKLTADDGASGDAFGLGVALDGDTAVIGAYADDDNGDDSGSAYVFEWFVGEDCNDNSVCDDVDLLECDGSVWCSDCNGNGVIDECDVYNTSPDCDGDGVPDECEPDCDFDGLIDDCDGPDIDGNGIPDNCEPDCNGNLIPDHYEIEIGLATDCDGNGIPDGCDLEAVFDVDVLTADDGASNDYFGNSVAVDGGVAVIGAQYDDGSSGSAYVFEQQADGAWQQIAKLTADDGSSYDEFGISVALDAGMAVIGAHADDDNGGNSGSAYVYEQQANGTWQQIAKLTADDGAGNDYFGYSVAIDGGVAVIGAYRDDDAGSDSGSAYVFEQQADGTWQQTAKLTADDGASNDYFGNSVAVDGGVAVIGAYGDDDNGGSSGSVYVYEQQADGTWQQIAKLTADDGASGDAFGYSVATSGGVAVIGAYGDDDAGNNSGSAYVYEQQANGTWQQIAKLTADDGSSYDEFGTSVAIDGDVAVIGAYGDDDTGDNSGSAYVFLNQGGTWIEHGKLQADSWSAGDSMGRAVAVSADTIMVGSPNADSNGSDAGLARIAHVLDLDLDGIFDACEEDCNNNSMPDDYDIAAGFDEDCDENGIPDQCDIDAGGDANGNGYLDVCECLGDVAGTDGAGFPDGEVGTNDLLAVIGYWGSDNSIVDINGDGIVGTNDLLAVLSAWGPCP